MSAIKSYNQLNQLLTGYDIQNISQQDIDFIILGIEESFIYNYSKLTLLLNNEINDQFIIKPTFNIEKENKIKIKFNDIIFRTFKGKLYLEITKILKINDDNQNIILIEKYNSFNFSFLKYANNFSELKKINKNSLVSIPVKVKEKETFNGTSTTSFKDINKKGLIINYDDKTSKVEGQKIYILEGFLYNNEEEKLIQLQKSNIREVNESLNKNENIIQSDILELFHFKGKIKLFDFTNQIIKIENEENKNLIEIEMNTELFSKISLNCDCYFYNFSKINDNKYKSNYFSDIKYKQKTFITVNFIDDLNNKYYDSIKYDDIIKEIKNNNITFEVDDYSNKTSEIKTITYQKKNINNQIIEQTDFHIEINCGKKNNVDSLSTKTDGYSYQLYFESDDKKFLPQNYVIKDEQNSDISIKPENNENEFCERFTIINVPNQNIKENYQNKNLVNFKLNKENNQENEEKSFKYLFTNNNNINKTYKFILKHAESCKIFYEKYKKYESDLEKFFKNYYPKGTDVLHRDIKLINESEKDEEIRNLFSNEFLKNDLKDVIVEGFDRYYFNNCRRDYILIRNICFAFLCIQAKTKKLDLISYSNIFPKFKGLLAKLSMEYIDRIKALIAIIREFHYQGYDYTKLGLRIIKSKTKDQEYSYYTNAMDKFLKIINGLTENCAFYKGIRQFNGIILIDEFSKKNMYSGTILNIKDIKIELFKHAGQFCIIQEGIPNLYGSYWSCARTIFLNPDNTFGRYYKKTNLKNKEYIYKRATAGTLFIIFHEVTGHLKTHINSLTDSPGQTYINNQKIQMIIPDSGYYLEYIMADNIICCKYFINSDISETLLDEKLYLGDNFNELKVKQKKKKNALSPMNVINTKKKKKKIKYSQEQLDDINENYDKMTIDELFSFFSGLNDEEMAKMEDSDAYKFFTSFFNERGKKF